MIEGVTDWRKEKRKASRKLDLRKLKRKRSLSNVIKLRNSNTILYLGFFFM